ncbi:DUF7289 family protein [Halorarum salinum]|uniref:DUF7308 domain-containing protein n=1 Tax=Halorarum salinum TaxID=2743089 RepID=A0A7D5QBT2_9EURY|nr:archaellin/type IV pilin N-terminal domain-containing protein [Halobaculum salinum]QLG62798.1 hypothetical protein HUG12_14110 [Halobaculum salinum]
MTGGKDDRAQSTTIGFVLLVAITIAGAGAVVGLGGQALEDSRSTSTVDRVENAMTQFDSRTSMVALGDSSSQRVEFGDGGDGTYGVEEDAGWIRVTHHNYSDGDDHEVYNESLGAVRYTEGDTTVAYQGGGVWRSDGGGSMMVSPPEVTYRDATLTLPVVRTVGSGGAGGAPTAYVRKEGATESIYPNSSRSYPDPDGRPYLNPVRNGTVVLTVHSEYYEAWGRYFDTRTEGNVTIYHGNRTAHVELETGGDVGDFRLPSRSNAVEARGIADGHSVDDFSITLESDNGNFNNMYFAFHGESDGKEYEMMIHTPSGTNPKCSGGEVQQTSPIVYDILYRGDGHDDVHAWTNDSVETDSGPIRFQCDGNDVELAVDFTGGTNLTYGDHTVSNDDLERDWDDQINDSVHFGHEQDGEPMDVEDGNETTSRHLVRHYMANLAPDIDLVVYYSTGGNGNGLRLNNDMSYGSLRYETAQGPQYITYLHVTENRVRVEFR